MNRIVKKETAPWAAFICGMVKEHFYYRRDELDRDETHQVVAETRLGQKHFT